MHLSEREVLIGKHKHAAYKPCYWTEQSLRTGGRRQCYKHDFGIKSHQCIQSTSFRGCNIACSFCWRDVEGRQHNFQKVDKPEAIAEQLVSKQQAIIEQSLPFALDNYENMVKVVFALSKCKKPRGISEIAKSCKISNMRVKDAINDLKNAGVIQEPSKRQFKLKTDLVPQASHSLEDSREIIERNVASRKDIIEVHLEAAKPKHVAISYDGEPTMYSRIGELIREFRKRNISTFVVTNGTFPERIAAMKEAGDLPTQLYVTLAAPDKDTYLRVCSSVKPYFPVHEDHWQRLNKTLGMLEDLGCRTVIRITCVRSVNMINPEGYRRIVQKANPNFLEVKGFSISGNAPRISERLGETNLGSNDPTLMKRAFRYAPIHEEVLDFAKGISDNFSLYPKLIESELNREVLMGVRTKSFEDVSIDFEKEL
ncbi:MAG: radical SAM protein [Nitrososphaerota archaeon]|nr:radical SAM protein [Nitrososphaerota archaeon]